MSFNDMVKKCRTNNRNNQPMHKSLDSINKMIVDVILDRKGFDEEGWTDWYTPDELLVYRGDFDSAFDYVMDAIESGSNERAQDALCRYIHEEEYNPAICDYIRSVDWVGKGVKKSKSVKKDYTAYHSDDLERVHGSKVHDGRSYISGSYESAINNEASADENVKSATKELADYVAIRYGNMDVTGITATNGYRGSTCNFTIKSNNGYPRFSYIEVIVSNNNEYGDIVYVIKCTDRVVGNETRHATSLTEAENCIDEIMREVVPDYFASARKNMKKSRSVKKDYTQVESDKFDWNLVGDSTPSSEKDVYDIIYNRSKHDEEWSEESMSILHEIADYISIRYPSMGPASSDISSQGYMNASRGTDDIAWIDYESTDDPDIGMSIHVKAVSRNTYSIYITIWNDHDSDAVTAYSVSEATDLIDRAIRRIDPSYSASARKNVRKSSAGKDPELDKAVKELIREVKTKLGWPCSDKRYEYDPSPVIGNMAFLSFPYDGDGVPIKVTVCHDSYGISYIADDFYGGQDSYDDLDEVMYVLSDL